MPGFRRVLGSLLQLLQDRHLKFFELFSDVGGVHVEHPGTGRIMYTGLQLRVGAFFQARIRPVCVVAEVKLHVFATIWVHMGPSASLKTLNLVVQRPHWRQRVSVECLMLFRETVGRRHGGGRSG